MKKLDGVIAEWYMYQNYPKEIMIQKLKDWLTRKNVDPQQDYLEVHNYHVIFYFYLTYSRLVPPEQQSKWSVAWIAFVMVGGVTACYLLAMSLLHSASTRDLGQLTQGGTYMFMIVVWVLWPGLSIRDRRHYLELLRVMQEDFDFVCTEGRKYRQEFLENQLLVFKASFGCAAFIFSIAVSMWATASLSIVLYAVRHVPDDGLRRSQIFPFWLSYVDVTETPCFEILYFASYLYITGFGYVISMFLVVLVTWLGHILAKAAMIASTVRGMLEGVREPQSEEELLLTTALLRARVKQVVQQHLVMYSLLDHFSCVFGKYLMYQQLVTVPVVCLTAYGFAEGLDNGQLDIIMLVLFVAGSVQCFIPSYACSVIEIKLASVIEECGQVEWWILGCGARAIRVDLLLVMMRALRPPCLRAAGFKEVSLETFSGVMTSAYSCFNMLRQVK